MISLLTITSSIVNKISRKMFSKGPRRYKVSINDRVYSYYSIEQIKSANIQIFRSKCNTMSVFCYVYMQCKTLFSVFNAIYFNIKTVKLYTNGASADKQLSFFVLPVDIMKHHFTSVNSWNCFVVPLSLKWMLLQRLFKT